MRAALAGHNGIRTAKVRITQRPAASVTDMSMASSGSSMPRRSRWRARTSKALGPCTAISIPGPPKRPEICLKSTIRRRISRFSTFSGIRTTRQYWEMICGRRSSPWRITAFRMMQPAFRRNGVFQTASSSMLPRELSGDAVTDGRRRTAHRSMGIQNWTVPIMISFRSASRISKAVKILFCTYTFLPMREDSSSSPSKAWEHRSTEACPS